MILDSVAKITYTKDKVWRVEILREYFFNGLTIPKGCVTNGGSIPRFLWYASKYLFPVGPGLAAFINHDHRIAHRTTYMSREEIDGLFYADLLVCDYPERWAKTLYVAVRLYAIVKRRR